MQLLNEHLPNRLDIDDFESKLARDFFLLLVRFEYVEFIEIISR